MPRPLPDDVVAKVEKLVPAGEGWKALCPAHEDKSPSLSLTMTAEDKLLVHCHADCSQDDVLAALDLGKSNGFHRPSRPNWTPRGDAVMTYDYRDENGKLLYQVLRTADKQFTQRRPDSTNPRGWAWNLNNVRRVLFRLPELIKARDEGKSVCITEGEKDVLALVALGKVATCNSGGAGKWRPEYAAYFTDLDVTIFADKDKPGQEHARSVAASLEGVAKRVWIVEAAEPHKDIAAHLIAGLTINQVIVTHDPTDTPRPDLFPDLLDLLAGTEPDHDWLVPGLLERGERFMLTGFEGLGKTFWLRQLAVCMAAGLDPVTFARIKPLTVMMIDCENSDRQTKRNFRPLAEQAERDGCPLQPGQLRVKVRPEGIDLPNADETAWLVERVVAHRPDVLIIGPLYRLHLGNPNDEETARRVVGAIDAARTRVDCAVIIEAHAGHGEWGKHRSVRPVGSSLYLRWPEFGYGMRPVESEIAEETPRVDLVPWRGPRDERSWPRVLRRDKGWPWVPDISVLIGKGLRSS